MLGGNKVIDGDRGAHHNDANAVVVGRSGDGKSNGLRVGHGLNDNKGRAIAGLNFARLPDICQYLTKGVEGAGGRGSRLWGGEFETW